MPKKIRDKRLTTPVFLKEVNAAKRKARSLGISVAEMIRNFINGKPQPTATKSKKAAVKNKTAKKGPKKSTPASASKKPLSGSKTRVLPKPSRAVRTSNGAANSTANGAAKKPLRKRPVTAKRARRTTGRRA